MRDLSSFSSFLIIDESISIFLTSFLQFIVILTIPPPDVPATSKLDKLSSLSEAPFQSSIEIMKDVIKVYESAFIDVDKFLVAVPYRSDPNELYDFLNRQGCLN